MACSGGGVWPLKCSGKGPLRPKVREAKGLALGGAPPPTSVNWAWGLLRGHCQRPLSGINSGEPGLPCGRRVVSRVLCPTS